MKASLKYIVHAVSQALYHFVGHIRSAKGAEHALMFCPQERKGGRYFCFHYRICRCSEYVKLIISIFETPKQIGNLYSCFGTIFVNRRCFASKPSPRQFDRPCQAGRFATNIENAAVDEWFLFLFVANGMPTMGICFLITDVLLWKVLPRVIL